jgi:hypothetical protein
MKGFKIIINVLGLIGALICMMSYLLYLTYQPKLKEFKIPTYDIKSKWKGGNTHR